MAKRDYRRQPPRARSNARNRCKLLTPAPSPPRCTDAGPSYHGGPAIAATPLQRDKAAAELGHQQFEAGRSDRHISTPPVPTGYPASRSRSVLSSRTAETTTRCPVPGLERIDRDEVAS